MVADEVGVMTTDNVYMPIQAVEVVDDRINLYRHIIALNGKESQCRMAMEECAELIQAVNKCLRYPTGASIANLTEEIADVEIMIEQLKLMFKVSDNAVEQEKDRKVDRMRMCKSTTSSTSSPNKISNITTRILTNYNRRRIRYRITVSDPLFII